MPNNVIPRYISSTLNTEPNLIRVLSFPALNPDFFFSLIYDYLTSPSPSLKYKIEIETSTKALMFVASTPAAISLLSTLEEIIPD